MLMAKESGKRSSIVLPCLLGLTVAYQMVFHLVIWQKVPLDTVESPVTCWSSQHKEQQAQGQAIDGQCAEVEIFQKWQSSTEPEVERVEEAWFLNEPDLLAVDSFGKTERISSYSAEKGVQTSAGLKLRGKSIEPMETPTSAAAPRTEIKSDSENTTNNGSGIKEAMASKPPMDSDHWASDLLSLQANMDVEMHRLAELHKAHEEHHKQTAKKMDKLGTAKPDLLVKIEDLQMEMCSNPKRRSHPSCISFLSSHPMQHQKNTSVMQTVRNPRQDAKKNPPRGTMKARKMARKSKSASIMEDLKKKLHDLDEGLDKIHHKHEVWERSMASRALAIRVQMCAESHHRHNKACEELMHEMQPEPALERNEKEASEIPISGESPAVAADPLHLLHLPTWTASQKRGSRFMQQRIESRRQVLKKADLNSKHWGGKIPKVACIMAIPESNATSPDPERQSAVKRAVDAFRAESYEGPKQLIMVYQYHDKPAAKLAKQIADGTYIKAVGARSQVPSTMALRFGAWESDSDADVIARWDIDAYHHPERLSMQVRALGYSGRPASLNMWGVNLKQDGTRSVIGEPFGLENSMVGLRLYMERNWRPFAGDDAPDHLAKVGDLVHLDMPELTRK